MDSAAGPLTSVVDIALVVIEVFVLWRLQRRKDRTGRRSRVWLIPTAVLLLGFALALFGLNAADII